MKLAGELVLAAIDEADRMIEEAHGDGTLATVTQLVTRDVSSVDESTSGLFSERAWRNARAHASKMVTDAGGDADSVLPASPEKRTLERSIGAVFLSALNEADRLRSISTRMIHADTPRAPELVVEPQPTLDIDVASITARRLIVARLAGWVEVTGLIVMLFVAYQLWGTGFQESHAQAQLRDSFAAVAASGPTDKGPTTSTTTPADTRGISGTTAHEGSVIAHIQIPKIHVDQFVVEGTKLTDLAKGPGHYTATAMPGQLGNVAIAGHRETHGSPFERLDELRPGDRIVVTTKAGRFVYAMRGSKVVPPSDITVLRDFGDNRLTLTTCTPKYTSLNRLIIVAKPVTSTPPKPRRVGVGVKPAAEAQLLDAAVADSGWHLHAAGGAALWVGLVVFLGLAYRRFRALIPGWSGLLVLVPVWCWVLLGLFEHLDKLLPSSV